MATLADIRQREDEYVQMIFDERKLDPREERRERSRRRNRAAAMAASKRFGPKMGEQNETDDGMDNDGLNEVNGFHGLMNRRMHRMKGEDYENEEEEEEEEKEGLDEGEEENEEEGFDAGGLYAEEESALDKDCCLDRELDDDDEENAVMEAEEEEEEYDMNRFLSAHHQSADDNHSEMLFSGLETDQLVGFGAMNSSKNSSTKVLNKKEEDDFDDDDDDDDDDKSQLASYLANVETVMDT